MTYGRRDQDALAGGIVDFPQGYSRLLNVMLLLKAEQLKTMNTCKQIHVHSPMAEHYRWATDATENDPGSRLGVGEKGEAMNSSFG